MLRRLTPFLVLSCLLLLAILTAHIFSQKETIHLFLNAYHAPWLSYAMRSYTHVGEWVPYVVAALLLFYKLGWTCFLLGDMALSGAMAQIAKYAVDTDRPYRWFANHLPDIQLQFVDGVRLSKFYSFPSGHTTTFFCLFMVLAIILTSYNIYHYRHDTPLEAPIRQWCNLLIGIVCFLLAVLGAYSRIYLNQHFLEDIFGGMIVGISSTLLCLLLLYIFPRWQHSYFWNWSIHTSFLARVKAV